MGSKCRIHQKVRKNPDFIAQTRHLDAIGLRWRVMPHPGKGHPFLRITLADGREVDFTIACTPRGSISADKAAATIRRFLAAQG